MSHATRLWIPGPTQVREGILDELRHPMVGHRSQAMSDLVAAVDPGLRLAFGVGPDSPSVVAVGNHSATAMMEGALHGVGPRVLSVVNGAFSKRWRDVAQTIGKEVTTLEVEWGDAVDADGLAAALEASGPFDAVTIVVNETSTGVRTPLAPLRAVFDSHRETLLLTDVVSAVAGYALDFDANGVDFALAGVQKALALPPGITVMCASERYLAQARSRERPVWYLDPVRTIDGHVARKTPTTPCIPLYRALVRQLDDISGGADVQGGGASPAEAWDARFARHQRMRERTLAWAAGHGIEPFPRRELSSPTVSCLRAGGHDVATLIAGLKERGHEIGNGYGALKGETFRIGHMGDHRETDLEDLLACADEVLASA